MPTLPVTPPDSPLDARKVVSIVIQAVAWITMLSGVAAMGQLNSETSMKGTIRFVGGLVAVAAFASRRRD